MAANEGRSVRAMSVQVQGRIRLSTLMLSCVALAGCAAGLRINAPSNGGFADIDGSVTARVTIQGGSCPGSFSAALDGLDVTSAFLPRTQDTKSATFNSLATGNHMLVVRANAGANCQAFKRKVTFYHAGSSTIYLVDGENSLVQNDRVIQIADMSGTAWTAFGSPGPGTGQFAFPRGIAAFHINRLFVTDQANHRVVEMRGMNGAGFNSLGTFGAGPLHFDSPMGIAVDRTGRLYVANSGRHEIVRFDDMTGANWTAFGTEGNGVGQFRGPVSIALDRNGRIYVADGINNRIVRIDDMSGANFTTFGVTGSGNGVGEFGSLAAISLDASGRIYAADTGNCRVARIDNMIGAGWTFFGSNGTGVGQFDCTSGQMLGIHVDGAGQIYVADQGNSRLVRVDDMTGDGWVSLGSYGSGVNQFVGPNGVFVKPPVMAIAP